MLAGRNGEVLGQDGEGVHQQLVSLHDGQSVLLGIGCGICYAAGTLLWMYILKKFPFSMAYPMISLSYVFGMLAAIFIFHESIPATRWIGVFLIMSGCVLIAR